MAHGHHIHFVEEPTFGLLITFLILKLTFESILNECNRLASEQQSREQLRELKSRLIKIQLDYEKGLIDREIYSQEESRILEELNRGSGGGN